MKYILIYIVFLFWLPVSGQSSLHRDTIKINEVIISRKLSITDKPGFKNIMIDSAIMQNYSQRSLADILSIQSGIFIKSYGMGGSASPAFRGTGAGHTLVSWNGININHPMLGQSDLSLLPVGMIDNIQIGFGGSSMALNSGGIGGMINLESKPEWTMGTSAVLSSGIGSFGQFSELASVKMGNLNFQSSTKAFYTYAENNFRYKNDEIGSLPVWETRANNQLNQKGLMQKLYFRWQRNVLSAHLWYQNADRNLPASMVTQQVGINEKQSDESFRAILNFDHESAGSKIFITGALMTNRLDYLNTLALIDSRNLSNIITLKAGMERKIFGNTPLRVILSEELNMIYSNNYSDKITRNTSTITASSEPWISDRVRSSVLIREIIDADKLLVPDFAAGLQFKILEEREDLVKVNMSRNSKIPSMNDLHWLPGGNPELRNEFAFIYELSYEMSRAISPYLNLNYDVSLFRNEIRDMILWTPGEYSYWTAENVQNVNTTGLETSVSVKYKSNNVISVLNASYSFTKATDSDSDTPSSQLLYIPENQICFSWSAVYGNLYSSWISNFTGRRFITIDNTKYLPGYFINSISAGYKIKFKENLLDLNFCIDNIFNENYQSIAHFPLPGRSYSAKLLIQINK